MTVDVGKLRNAPKKLTQVSITGADGQTIHPGDGIIAGAVGRAEALKFGIYIGIVDSQYERRIYYLTEGSYYDRKAKKWTREQVAKYQTDGKSAPRHTRICKIPVAQAQKGMSL